MDIAVDKGHNVRRELEKVSALNPLNVSLSLEQRPTPQEASQGETFF